MGLATVRGWRASYTGPDGIEFDAVVLRPTDESGHRQTELARELRCAGWQVAVAADGRAFAASSGTTHGQLTPETPVVMDRTPVADSADAAAALLALSPALTDRRVAEAQVGCDDFRTASPEPVDG
jgi:hypothetical protein